MEIFLIRHAIAAARGDNAYDHARPLTPKGRTRFEQSVRGAKLLGWEFDQVLHSPFIRAAQTAELLAPLKGEECVTEASPRLAATPGPDLLDEFRGPRTAVVGHEPFLAELAALLLFGDVSEGDRFQLKKGGAILVSGTAEPGGSVLSGFYPPSELRRLGT